MDYKKLTYRLNDQEITEIKRLLLSIDAGHICEKWVFNAANKAIQTSLFSYIDDHDAHSYGRCCDQVGCSGKGDIASLRILEIFKNAKSRGDINLDSEKLPNKR